MEFREYMKRNLERIQLITSLFHKKNLTLSYDLLSDQVGVDFEILYVKQGKTKERTGVFIFGSWFFLSELSEQEFKSTLGMNSLNFRIFRAYKELSKNKKRVKISDILNTLESQKKGSFEKHSILERILTLAYYFNWEIEKDLGDIEGDSFIHFPDKYLMKLQQRFNFDVLAPVYENEQLFIFVNARNKLNLVFKNKDIFTKEDVNDIVLPVLQKVFNIKSIKIDL